jgi:flagellar biosynthesis protein FlhF
MKIKTFTADSVAAALKLVRQEMGSAATVLRTSQVKNDLTGKQIEITACHDDSRVGQKTSVSENALSSSQIRLPDEHSVPNESLSFRHSDRRIIAENVGGLGYRLARIERKLDHLIFAGLQFQPDQSRFGNLAPIFQRLKDADLPLAYIESFIASLLDENDDRSDVMTVAYTRLYADLSSMIEPDLKFKPGDKVLFIGPAGAGKSSVMGKLATRLVVRHKQKVTLASLDYHRMAAHEELAGYAEILQTGIARSLEEIEIGSKNGDTITLIDSPPVPANPKKMAELKNRIEKVAPNYRVAVFSALTRIADIEKLSEQLRQLGPTHLAVTMLDLTTRYGSAIAGATALDVKLALVTDSMGGQGEVKVPDPNELALAMLNGEAGCE